MGQYYTILNKTKKEMISTHTFGDGCKLLEFGCSANGTLTGLAILLANSNGRGGGDLNAYTEDYKKCPKLTPKIELVAGRWAGDSIVIQGDYVKESDPGYEPDLEGFKDISAQVLVAMMCDQSMREEVLERGPDPFGGYTYDIACEIEQLATGKSPKTKRKLKSVKGGAK